MLNDFYQNVGLKGFVERYGVANALRRGMFTAEPIHYVKNYEMRKVLWQEKAAGKIEKYMKYSNQAPEELNFSDLEVDDPIWVYWNKGIDNAPDIIKCCYRSLKKYGNRELILLTEDNLCEYLQMPKYIEEKKAAKQIPLAGYTDLMRFALLEHYGGTWIDATVYLTEKIPEELLRVDFFAFQNTLGLLKNPVLYPAWFLHAKKHNKIITEVRNIAFAYWSKENHVVEYLLPNLIITKVIEKYPDMKCKIPYLNSDYSEYLIKVLGDAFSEEKWTWIKRLTGIHKLTYKLDASINQENSFYQHLVSTK